MKIWWRRVGARPVAALFAALTLNFVGGFPFVAGAQTNANRAAETLAVFEMVIMSISFLECRRLASYGGGMVLGTCALGARFCPKV